jgi:rare lipoprotein A
MQSNLRIAIAACFIASMQIFPVQSSSARSPQEITGSASWYGGKFHGRKTANGERYNQNALTAAHKTLPFGTKVRVTNESNGKSVVVRINDRGPYVGKRVIDLSRAAANAVGMVQRGVARVKMEVL